MAILLANAFASPETTAEPAKQNSVASKNALSASSKAPDSAKEQGKKPASNEDKTQNAGSKVGEGNSKSSKNKVVAKTKSSISRSTFVPPPPPVVPTLSAAGLGLAPTVVLGGELIEYMSGGDLKDLQSKTARDLSKARNNLETQNELLAEKQKRALSFDSLYSEGVVSRRELQNCKKEAADAETELEDAKLLLQELERKNDRIEARMKALYKPKSAATKSPKKP